MNLHPDLLCKNGSGTSPPLRLEEGEKEGEEAVGPDLPVDRPAHVAGLLVRAGQNLVHEVQVTDLTDEAGQVGIAQAFGGHDEDVAHA